MAGGAEDAGQFIREVVAEVVEGLDGKRKARFLAKPGEFATIKNPGQAYVFRLPILFYSCRCHDAPEILLLQLAIVRRFDKNTFEGIPCLKEKLGGALRMIRIGPQVMLDLFSSHTDLIIRLQKYALFDRYPTNLLFRK